MNLQALPQALIVCSVLALAAAGCATPEGGTPATKEGVVPVHSANVDELYLRPNADLSGYRRVLIDPVSVEFRSDWLAQRHAYNRIQAPSVYPYVDGERLARETAASLDSSLAAAFKARGYEIAAAPEPGVLRVSARVTELFINAPDRLSPWITRNFVRDAGQATLSLEARDAVSESVLARVVHRGIAREVARINLAGDTSNRMWLDTMLWRWAANSVAELKTRDRKSTRLNSSHGYISYAVFCLKKKKTILSLLQKARRTRGARETKAPRLSIGRCFAARTQR